MNYQPSYKLVSEVRKKELQERMKKDAPKKS